MRDFKTNNPDKIKKIFITGSTGALGSAISKILAKTDAALFLNYKAEDTKGNLKNELRAVNKNTYFFKADLTKESEIKDMMDKVSKIGDIDILVNCVSIHVDYKEIIDKEWADYQNHLDIQVKSLLYLLKRIIPSMKEKKFGKIINIVSETTIGKPPINRSDYIVSKYALLGLSKCLSAEYGRYNITCNCVSSGMMDTPLTSRIPSSLKKMIAYQTPLGRLCKVEDVAKVVEFLCSDKSDFITGENILIDGGFLMK